MNRKIIDAHSHVPGLPGYGSDITVEDILRIMDKNDIVLTVASSSDAVGHDPVKGNLEMIEVAEKYPDRYRVYLFLNPHYVEHSIEQINSLTGHDLVAGIKLYCHGVIKRPLKCPGHTAILEHYASKNGAGIVKIHLSETGLSSYQSLADYAKRFPSLSFIAAHGGGMEWRLLIESAAGIPNIYPELCCSNQIRGRVEDLVQAFGEDRALYGSDNPLIAPEVTLGTVVGADIAETTRQRILFENSNRLFNLNL